MIRENELVPHLLITPLVRTAVLAGKCGGIAIILILFDA
jgi:hypothetical protein